MGLDPHVVSGLPGFLLVPVPVQLLGHGTELDQEVTGEVLGLDLAPFFLPQSDQGGLVIAHDDPGVQAADKRAARA